MMNTKILLHIKVILFLVLQCVFISAVKGHDVACKVGESLLPNPNNIFTSGLASQCSGISKITTEAECKLAAEYNRKNNIDKNIGFGGGDSSMSWNPPGCIYESGNNKYWWNDYTKSTTKCSNGIKCICKKKTKTCAKCPINTYNDKDGINPTCTPCAKNTPTTKEHVFLLKIA